MKLTDEQLAQFDEEGCERGLEGLAAYEWSYDELNKVTRRVPKPGWGQQGG